MKTLAIIVLLLLSGCSTIPEQKTTHTECHYELVPDPSGSAKWKIVCIEVDNIEGGCGCFDDENLAPIDDIIDREIVL